MATAERSTRKEPKEAKKESFIVEGGAKLEGRLKLQGAKNVALQAIAAALLTDERVTLTNFPDIGDLRVNLGILKDLGAQVTRVDANTVIIDSKNISPIDINPAIAVKTTGSRYFIPVLVKRFGKLTTGPSGGDKIGGDDRYKLSEPILSMYRQMGVESRQVGQDGYERYEFTQADSANKLELSHRFFGPTVQSLLAHARSPSGQMFHIYNPSVEPEVFETIALLKSMGADIRYYQKSNGHDYIQIQGRPKLYRTDFRIMSDPNALVSYAAAALITDGEVAVEGVQPDDKITAFSNLLKRMNANFQYSPLSKVFVIYPSLAQIKPTNLETDFWPTQCHTDWQQLLTPVLAKVRGVSYIDENVTKMRFTSVHALSQMGANLQTINDSERITRESFKTDNLDHTLAISGPVNFVGAKVTAPSDVRGATSLLIAALSAEGTSAISGIEQIHRGLEDPVGILSNLGARIK